MKTLEIKLGEDLESKKEALRNFVGRIVFIQHPEFGRVKGKVINCKENYFELRKPTNDFIAFFADTIYEVSYQEMQNMVLVEPTVPDYIDEGRRSILKSNRASLSHY